MLRIYLLLTTLAAYASAQTEPFAATGQNAAQTFDVLIRQARVVDGSGSP
jgi:hypothetical protein